jgi:tRNA 2-selenouridine synthase
VNVPTADPAEVLAHAGAVVIDLRSPGEFALDHLPGAFNVPLFDDAERALIGTLYKQDSPDAAFAEGRRAAASRIAGLVREVAQAVAWTPPDADLEGRLVDLTEQGIGALEAALEAQRAARLPEAPVILHCWRGGLRSRSVVAFLRALGLDRAVGLEGGYRGWRRAVLDGLAEWRSPPTFVLRGLTGVGKTLVLRELERRRPEWVVDLEGLAGHRSSILGMVGLEPRTQKAFDSGLFARLARGFDGAVVFEGESRKVGDIILPVRVWDAIGGGTNLLLEAPIARRVQVLIDDYLATPGSRHELRAQLPFIEERLGPVKWKGVLVGLLDERCEAELVELLLEHYYDPLYRHSEKGRAYAARIDASDPRRAAAEIEAHIGPRASGAGRFRPAALLEER